MSGFARIDLVIFVDFGFVFNGFGSKIAKNPGFLRFFVVFRAGLALKKGTKMGCFLGKSGGNLGFWSNLRFCLFFITQLQTIHNILGCDGLNYYLFRFSIRRNHNLHVLGVLVNLSTHHKYMLFVLYFRYHHPMLN